MTAAERPWSVPLPVDRIPVTGTHVALAADEATRAAVARLAGLRSLPALTATFDVAPGARGIKVSGQVRATVGQTCVVSLEPIENRLEEQIEVVFAPPDSAPPAAGEQFVALNAAEPPEPLVGDVIDLGVIATEFLMLGIDPYPRKAGVEFDRPVESETGPSPFAALKNLKKDAGGKDS